MFGFYLKKQIGLLD